MKDTSPNILRYAGKKYTLVVEILVDQFDNKNPEQVFALDNTCISKIKYSSAFNELCLIGEIEYHDQYGKLDKLLDRQFAYCQLQFIEHIQKGDGQICVEKFDLGKKMIHNFLINKVQITRRQGNEIDYKLSLISSNWFKCSQNINYTNYDKSSKSVLEILKDCIGIAGLDIDKKTFRSITTSVKMNYITNRNDNLFTVKDFLLNRLYYFKSKDDSLKALLYNEQSDKFQLFDYKNDTLMNGSYLVVVSMFKSQNESMMEEEPNQFATIAEFPSSEYIHNTYNYEVHDFDYNYNTFVDQSFENTAVAQYLNAKSPTNTYLLRNKLAYKEFNGYQVGSYWNNDFSTYKNAIEQQLKMNALVLNTSGEILRKPGSLVTVSLDRSFNTVQADNKDSLNETKYKYLALEGMWIVGKVVHIIEPQKQRYRQNLTLTRNYRLQEAIT